MPRATRNKKTDTKGTPEQLQESGPVANAQQQRESVLMQNVADMLHARTKWIRDLIDPKRNIDSECGYPTDISISQYSTLYDRGDLCARVVDILPTESWKRTPEITSNQAGEETDFEKQWKALDDKHHLWSMLERADIISGIGRFGIILLGIGDNNTLDQEVTGTKNELLYLRVFDESCVTITAYEEDSSSARFQQPKMYSLTFREEGTPGKGFDKSVHWTRVIHIADNRRNSETFGRPRMELVFNRLYDLRKVLGGAGEMFWKGGFPGYSLKIDPSLKEYTLDKPAIKAEMESYFNQLQRFLLLDGAHVESLSPQVADPTAHFKVFIMAICIALRVPYRIFLGSEEAQLAGEQDASAWRDRLTSRIQKYVEPYVVRPVVDRFMQYGILPYQEKYFLNWPDLFTLGDKEQAEIAAKWVEAMAKYIAGDCETIIAPLEFLTHIMGLSQDEAADILKRAAAWAVSLVASEEDGESEESEDEDKEEDDLGEDDEEEGVKEDAK